MMKWIKRFFLFLISIVLMIMLVALFFPTSYSVKRDVIINRPKEEVFAFVKQLKNQDLYSVWQQMDPNMEKSFSGIDGTIGFTSSWKSKNREVGSGSQTILRLTEGDSMVCQIAFKEPFESINQNYFTTTSEGDTGTRVEWGFKGEFPYPLNLFAVAMDMESMIGKDFQQGLNNMKVILEKNR
jgi:hypothetical protein